MKVRVTKVLHNVGFAEVLQRSEKTAEAPAEEAEATEETPQAEDSETFGDERVPKGFNLLLSFPFLCASL